MRTPATVGCWARWFWATLLALALGPVAAQVCALPGWDGPAIPSGVVNSYHAGSGSPAAGATSITVASVSGQRSNTRSLRAGDLILIMQMQDSATPANAGLHEYAQVVAVTGSTLLLSRPLANSYTRSMSTSAVRNWQVVWVPQYSAATISGTVSADRWTIAAGSGDATGGVVAMDVAGSLAINGTITVAGAGFRGGAGMHGTGSRAGGTYTDAHYNFTTTVAAVNGGVKGEGIEGTPFVVFDGTATPVNYFTLLGQGYALGAAGRAARSNAGGGANDGLPASGNNQYNSGGGGGANAGAGGRGGNAWNSNSTGGILNQPLGGNTGNEAGGLGGDAQTNSAARLVMGGGGGAGSTNNAATPANAVTTWPPSTSTMANGAEGAISSSGASGGGVVLVRAGALSATAGVITADGYHAHNRSPVANSDSAGGGGAGGSVVVLAGSGSGAGLSIFARGGYGGRSNYFNHGPGGGGGGGYVLTNFAGATVSVIQGLQGQDACCGGTNGNGSPKFYNATAGAAGTAITTGGTPSGLASAAQCLPQLALGKVTTTPLVTASTGATAVYAITLANSGGAASNVYLLDVGLPPGWTYLSTPAPTYTYAPAPPPAAGSAATGAETTAAVLPAGLPVNTAVSANSATAVSLRAAGAAPGVVPSAGANTLSFGSFFIPQSGTLTVAFAVSIPDTATAGTYHNPAGVLFLDPTRTTAAARMVTPATNASANRSAVAYSANTSYASGSTTNVAGSNFSGLAGGPSTEDVTLQPNLRILKSAPATTATAGQTFTYVIAVQNIGRPVAHQIYASTQASDQSATAIASNPLRWTDTLPAGFTATTATASTALWACAGTGTGQVTCAASNPSAAAAYPIAGGTLAAPQSVGTVTLTVSPAVDNCASTSVTNTVTLSVAGIGETSTADNTATLAHARRCGADIRVAKTNGVSSLNSGQTTAYTVTISNLGPSAAAGTTVTDSASAGLACTTVTCSATSAGICPAASMPFASLTAGIALAPNFPAGSTATLVVSCNVTATGF